MAIDLGFRRKALKALTTQVGCYVLCDLDHTPIYVGKSKDGIRARVNRHLTSARSDIVANRQVDVWEIAWVWAFPSPAQEQTELENALFHKYHPISALMNGKVPPPARSDFVVPEATQVVQVMRTEEIKEKLDPALRLPRQAEHYQQILGHFLAVKNSNEIALSIQAHFQRLRRYHNELLKLAEEIEGDTNSSDD